ncbi:MAG: helicase-exonuclease AddAB subunit AddB [Clostridia bacterium]|nr:helicase-exonuclease AddAB subunit AddB [Clostridia bacterium]
MSLRIVYGRAGTGKSEFCFDEISKLINKNNKIFIITPEQFSFTAEKKLMDAITCGATFNAEVLTFSRMAYRVLSEVGGVSNIGLTKSGRAMLVYSILTNQKNNLKFLSKSDENIDICLNAISEFKKHGIGISNLKNEINSLENKYLKTKLIDITTVYEQFENQIANKYIDDTDLLTILAEKIEETSMFKNSLIYIDEFAGFTNQEYNIIKKLLECADTVTVTCCTDELTINTNPDTDIFYSNKMAITKIMELVSDSKDIEKIELSKSRRFKNEELQHIEKNIYNNMYKQYNKEPESIKLFLAQNYYSEIENIAKSIVKKVRDENYRYKDIAIITKNVDTYSSQIRAIFNQYDIPVFIDEKRTLSQSLIIQYILALLEVINKNWSHESAFSYIKTGFLNLSEEDIFKLENYCIKWGIKHNKWLNEFKYEITDEASKHEVERLNEIRVQITEPVVKLKNHMQKERTAEALSKNLYNFLIEQGIENKLNEKIEELNGLGLIDIANEYKESYNILITLLDEITELFKDDNITFDKYINLLKIGLKNSGLGKIPEVADQVIIGDVDRSRSHKVKSIYIIGLNDGMFPSINKNEGYLNDSDRESLKQDGIELAKGTIEKLYEDNFNIYKAFATAEENINLSYSSTDQEGKSLRPSILIPKIKRIFPKLCETSDMITQVDEILTPKTTYNELITNINRLKSGEDIDKIWYSVYNYYKTNTSWNKKLEENLKGLDYTNIPNQISRENIDKLYGNTLTTSVSKLEKYRSCPFSYYLQYGLNLKEKEQLKVQSINTGTFMHEIIDQFFENVKEEGIVLDDITEEQIKTIVEKIISENLNLGKNYIFTSTAKYKILVLRLKRIVIKAIKYIVETITQSKFDILGTEVEFGNKGKYKPIILNLENGKRVEIIGKIDRIDIGKNEGKKYLRIIDYKSSVKNIDLNEVYAGIQIQLLTYMDAVCKEEDAISAGVLYFSLLDQMVKSDKQMTKEEIEAKIKENFKMKGLILADIKVVKMHDKTLESGASNLVPAYIDKSGNLSKKTNGITKEEFVNLQKYIDKTIKDISNEILKGNIDIKPYYKNGNTPCRYCSYKSICGFNIGLCKNEYNYIGNENKDEILERIKNEKSIK